MSYASLLNSTGTISRKTETSRDRMNRPVYTWADVATVACRTEPADFKGDWETFNRFLEEGALRVRLGFIPYGTDVREEDRFTTDGVTYDIMAVASPVAGQKMGQGKHIEMWLRQVN